MRICLKQRQTSWRRAVFNARGHLTRMPVSISLGLHQYCPAPLSGTPLFSVTLFQCVMKRIIYIDAWIRSQECGVIPRCLRSMWWITDRRTHPQKVAESFSGVFALSVLQKPKGYISAVRNATAHPLHAVNTQKLFSMPIAKCVRIGPSRPCTLCQMAPKEFLDPPISFPINPPGSLVTGKERERKIMR